MCDTHNSKLLLLPRLVLLATPAEQPSLPDDHSESVPPLPIPNRTVKRLYADDSADSRVKVGNRQAPLARNPRPKGGGFCIAAAEMRAEYSAWMLVVPHALALVMPLNAERAECNFSSVVTVVEVTCSAAADHLHQGSRRSASRRAITRQQSGAKGPALSVLAPRPLLGQLLLMSGQN